MGAAATPAPIPYESQAMADLCAMWHPPLSVTAEVLLELAEMVDAAAWEPAAASAEASPDEVLAYRMDLAEAVVTLSTGDRLMEEAFDNCDERFFNCDCFPGEPEVPNDELGDAVHHAAIGCALVRTVDFDGKDWPGRAAKKLLDHTSRGSRYKLEGHVRSDVSPTLLLRHVGSRTLIVACRSSQEFSTDWRANLSTQLEEPPQSLRLPTCAGEAGGAIVDTSLKVHKGFGRAAAALLEHVFPKIDDWQDQSVDNRRVVFTGHSLGAAVSTLLAVAYKSVRNIERPSLVTFGGPRLGNAALAAVVVAHTTHTRVVTSGDKVPGMPARAGYVPTRAERHWELCSESPLLRPRGDDETATDKRGATVAAFFSLLTCHRFRRYVKILTRLCEETRPSDDRPSGNVHRRADCEGTRKFRIAQSRR